MNVSVTAQHHDQDACRSHPQPLLAAGQLLEQAPVGFGDAVASARSAPTVPTYPDWTADDLLWHQGRNQSWWAIILRECLRIVRHRMQPLQARVFELRQNLTAYDAIYVALAETLGLPLLTDDGTFTNTQGHRAEIHLYPD
jgi:hypothetical protein